MLEPPEWFLEDRRASGADRRDEVWDGVIHVAPQPTIEHQLLETLLELALGPVIRPLGLQIAHTVSVFDERGRDKNYRIPDVIVFDPARAEANGTTSGVQLVIEIFSPHDESRKKVSFYAARGIPELWLIEPATRVVEVYVLREGVYFGSFPDTHGRVTAPRFALQLDTVAGPKLRIMMADGSTVDV